MCLRVLLHLVCTRQQPRAETRCGPSQVLRISTLSSSGLDLEGPPEQLHGHTLASLHGMWAVGTSGHQVERTCVLGTRPSREQAEEVGSLSSVVVGSFGLYWCPVLSCSWGGAKLCLP